MNAVWRGVGGSLSQYATASAEEFDRRAIADAKGAQAVVVAERASEIEPENIVAHTQSTGEYTARSPTV